MDKSDKTDKSEKQEKPKKTERIKFFKNLVGNLKMNVPGSKIPDIYIDEPFKKEDFSLTEAIRYGFPNDPRSIAFDPLRRLVAIGSCQGHVRIIGKPGVDIDFQLSSKYNVELLTFIIADGTLLCVTEDGLFHLYDLKAKMLTQNKCQGVVKGQDLITYIYTHINLKYVYFGTARGNVKILNLETFEVSKNYDIMWNKAIELKQKTNPGPVVHISESLGDQGKILIAYKSGLFLLWDLKLKVADFRVNLKSGITSITWQHEGKQYLISHTDGSFSTWVNKSLRPISIYYPHSKDIITGAQTNFQPIQKIVVQTARNKDSFIIFYGGLPKDIEVGKSPACLIQNSVQSVSKIVDKIIRDNNDFVEIYSLTIINGKDVILLEFEYPIIDFIVCAESIYPNDFNEPYAVIVLTTEDISVVDLITKNTRVPKTFLTYRNVHTSLQLHQTIVTSTLYFSDASLQMNSTLYQMGMKCQSKSNPSNQKNSNVEKKLSPVCTAREKIYSDRLWPINGGECSKEASDFAELLITGHGDGSVKFWDVSSSGFHLVLKIDCSKYFEKKIPITTKSSSDVSKKEPEVKSNEKQVLDAFKNSADYSAHQLNRLHPDSSDNTGPYLCPEIETPLGIEHICFSEDANTLVVSTFNSTIMYFKPEKAKNIPEVISVKVDMTFDQNSKQEEISQVSKGTSKLFNQDDFNSNRENINSKEKSTYIIKKNLYETEGFQAKLVIFAQPINENLGPPKITNLTYLTNHNLIAWGSEFGIYIFDAIQKQIIFKMCTKDIYGPSDPFQGNISKVSDTRNTDTESRASIDQPNGFCQSPTNLNSPLSNNQSSFMSNSNSTSSANQGQNFIANSAQSTPQHNHHQHVLTSQQSFCYSNTNKRFVHLTKEAVNSSASSNYSATNSSFNNLSKSSNNKRMLRMQSMCSLTDDQQAKSNFFNLSVGSTSDKIDTLSTSSSNVSFDRTERNESINSIVFCNSFYNKYETSASLTLWVGTSFGTVTAFPIIIPEKQNRETCIDIYQIKSPEIMHNLKSSIIHVSFLNLENLKKSKNDIDCKSYSSKGSISPYVLETKKIPPSNSNIPSSSSTSSQLTNNSSTSLNQSSNSSVYTASISPTTQQLLIIVSEKSALVILLPTHKIFGKAVLTSNAKRADVVYMKEKKAYCLNIFFSNNQLCIYSLPSLRLISKIFCLENCNLNDEHLKFGSNGFGTYLPTRSEVSKFCLFRSMEKQFDILKPILQKDSFFIPDPPKPSYLVSIFGSKELDKMELFGFKEISSKPSNSPRSKVPTMESLRNSIGSRSEFARTKQDLIDRGETAEKLENATEKLHNEASVFKENSEKLVRKYEKKKWFG